MSSDLILLLAQQGTANSIYLLGKIVPRISICKNMRFSATSVLYRYMFHPWNRAKNKLITNHENQSHIYNNIKERKF